MGHRRQAREFALQILHSIDLSGQSADEALAIFWQTNPASDELKPFTEELVRGVASKRGKIDEVISNYSSNWKISRMSTVDRNVLRMAVYELHWCSDIPAKVTLNEAIDIAKLYGTEDSGAFVNGILDQVAKNITK